jgi:hypothetical protein
VINETKMGKGLYYGESLRGQSVGLGWLSMGKRAMEGRDVKSGPIQGKGAVCFSN